MSWKGEDGEYQIMNRSSDYKIAELSTYQTRQDNSQFRGYFAQ